MTASTNTAPGYAGHSGAHTPGPWRVHKREDEILPTLVLGGEFGDDIVADCSSWHTGRSIDEAATNARLIAAAPEVVEHAKRVMALLAEHGPSIVPHLLDSDDNAGQRLRTALAKAGVRS